MDNEKNRPARTDTNGDVPGPRMTKAAGWLPQSDTLHTRSELDDPLLQQINNIESFLRQARSANRSDEVAMLEENLRQLQDEFDAQQTSRAIRLSQRLAEETDLQQSQIQHLQQRELEHRTHTKTSSDVRETNQRREDEEDERSVGDSPPLDTHTEKHTPTPPARNPFEEVEEKPAHSQTANGKKQYNPFEDEDDEEEDPGKAKSPRNPFEDEDCEDGNPFKEVSDEIPAASNNPFDEDDDEDDTIEEELLLQQIDNIRAYIFDAKLSGRSDEVELLSENLKELQRTLQEQKRKK